MVIYSVGSMKSDSEGQFEKLKFEFYVYSKD